MTSSEKVIITCAETGAIHTPSMSPYLPVTADQIAEAAIGAAEAGAAIVHLHARDERSGRPDQSPEAFARFLPRIKQSTKAVVNLTTGGAPYMTVQERVKPAEVFKPEVASLNMGSMNFGLFPMLNRYKSFKHDWEPHGRWRIRAILCFATLTRTSSSWCAHWATPARALSSNAMTLPISTTSRISFSADW